MSRAIPFLSWLLANQPCFTVIRPEGIRFSVTGNILDVQSPKKPWREHFGDLVGLPCSLPSPARIITFRLFAESNRSSSRPLLRQNPERSWQEARQQGPNGSLQFLTFNSRTVPGPRSIAFDNRELVRLPHFERCTRVRSSRPPCAKDYIERDERYRELLMGAFGSVTEVFILVFLM